MPENAGWIIMGVSGFVFLAILAGLVMHTIIGWYLDGAISGAVCALIAGIYIALLVAILIAPSVTVKVSLSLLIIALLILLPVISRSLADSNNRALDDEKIETYKKAIAVDPRNCAARSKLAELLYDRGLFEDAIYELSYVAKASPSSIAETHRLKKMLAEREERKAPSIKCPICGITNPGGRSQCISCGGELSIGREIRKWLLHGGLKQIVILCSITMLVLTVVLVAFQALPVLLKILFSALFLLIVISSEYLYVQKNW